MVHNGWLLQELSLLVIDEGQQYGTDREIAVISLLRQQPLVLWTGDSEQTPGGMIVQLATRNDHDSSCWPRSMGYEVTAIIICQPTLLMQ